jgi:protein gp37
VLAPFHQNTLSSGSQKEKAVGTNSAIEWTEATWNPVVGCSIVSPGCTNCYAMRMARRLEAMGQPKYVGTTRVSGGRAKWNGIVRMNEEAMELPMTWKKGRMIFVNSMSDLFHDEVPLDFIRRVFSTIHQTQRHTYQILTKRAERLENLSPYLDWPSNLWMGVSVESLDYAYRVDHLRRTGALVRFLSLEPLLGPLDNLDLECVHWVIVGGESGPGARPMKPEWVHSIRDKCLDSGVAFHFKQWGGVNKKQSGRVLDGRTWDQLPLRSRIGTCNRELGA